MDESPQQSQSLPSQHKPSAQQSLLQQSSGRLWLQPSPEHSDGDLVHSSEAMSTWQELAALGQHPPETISD
ncbi:MAG: hypothetical protein WCK15_10820 [Pirellula sp.]